MCAAIVNNSRRHSVLMGTILIAVSEASVAAAQRNDVAFECEVLKALSCYIIKKTTTTTLC